MNDSTGTDTQTPPLHWRWDASTSRLVRVLWALGVGAFLAAIVLIVFARLFALSGEIGVGQSVLIGGLLAIGVTVLALAVAGRTGDRLESLSRRLPLVDADSSGADLERALDVAIGAVVMSLLILVLARGVGGGVGQGAAAITVPLGLVALVTAVFLSSTGALDTSQKVLYLYEPEDAIDLTTLDGVRVRTIQNVALVTLSYDQSDGVYIPGPRRLVVPVSIADELESLVGPS